MKKLTYLILALMLATTATAYTVDRFYDCDIQEGSREIDQSQSKAYAQKCDGKCDALTSYFGRDIYGWIFMKIKYEDTPKPKRVIKFIDDSVELLVPKNQLSWGQYNITNCKLKFK